MQQLTRRILPPCCSAGLTIRNAGLLAFIDFTESSRPAAAWITNRLVAARRECLQDRIPPNSVKNGAVKTPAIPEQRSQATLIGQAQNCEKTQYIITPGYFRPAVADACWQRVPVLGHGYRLLTSSH